MQLQSPLIEQSETMSEEIVSRRIKPFVVEEDVFPMNVVKTSRYNAFTYLPKCLFEQFRRLANVYFVVLGVIALIGTYSGAYQSSVEPDSLLAPVVIVVMISVIKEGIEDFKRHQSDAKVNARPAQSVSPENGEVTEVQWQDLMVGSVVLLNCDEEIPADIAVLACGGVQGETAYVETAAIDGETNLKIKLSSLVRDLAASSSTKSSSSNPIINGANSSAPSASAYESGITVNDDKTIVSGINKLNICVGVEAPNASIHHFDGSAEFTDSFGKHQQSTLSEKNLLLRGSVLRATEWCVGIVVYTGKETKLSLNSRAPPSKLSTVDRVVNSALVVAIGSMIAVCFISMFFSIAWQNYNSDATYLCLQKNDLTPPYSQTDGGGCNSAAPSSFLTIFTFATLYNNFVCISMYVSLEMIYLCQAYFIENDLNLYDETTDTPAECHTSGMCADIGQVQYVLSDKTGTLTKNIMTLRRCSIAGLVYGAPLKPPDVTADEEDIVGEDMSMSVDDGLAVEEGRRTDGVSIVQPPKAYTNDSELSDIPDESGITTSPLFTQGAATTKSLRLSEIKSSCDSSPQNSTDKTYYELGELAAHRVSHPIAGKEDLVLEYLLNLAVCNTIMLMPDAKTGKLDITDMASLSKSLNAESPDEVALVLAAAEYGNELIIRRDATETLVRVKGRNGEPDADLSFNILATNEFDSTRKRMSCLVRLNKPNSPPVLYCKGADTSMLPHCNAAADTDACLQHIDEFAVTGLRTLVMSRRVLSEEEASKWLASHKAASNNIGRRQEMLSECALEIETNMELLGAVGIEDELQDGVSNAIQTLQRAGLNVWMITGDKPETAIAISEMCSLLRQEHQVYRLIGLKGEELRKRVCELRYLGERDAKRSELSEKVVNEKRRPALGKLVDRCTTAIASWFSQPEPEPEFDAEPGEHDHTTPAPLARMRSTIGGVAVGQLALVVDGTSLEGIWCEEQLKLEFTAAVRVFPTVVACRVSPLQKASLVRMVKTGAGQPITLAIGDGANDVGMIHESRVGVGISGREGRHAANSADFAIGQFQFLVPLLLHHGRFNYIRCSKLVLYSFFKNLVLVSVLFYYCFFSGFSGTVPLDSFVLSGYNFYLGLPIIALGALDFDISKEEAMKYPKLAYNSGRLGELLNNRNMFRWCGVAFVYGMMIYAVSIRYFTGVMSVDVVDIGDSGYLSMVGVGFPNQYGQDGGIYMEGFTIFTILVLAMQYKIVMMTNTLTYINWGVWWISLIGYLLFTWAYGLVPGIDYNGWFHTVNFSFQTAQYWLAIFMVPIMFVMVDYCFECTLSAIYPTSSDQLKTKIADKENENIVKV